MMAGKTEEERQRNTIIVWDSIIRAVALTEVADAETLDRIAAKIDRELDRQNEEATEKVLQAFKEFVVATKNYWANMDERGRE